MVMNIYLVIFITLIAAFIAAVSQLLYKKGMQKELRNVHDFIALAKNRTVVIGGIGYVSSLIVYLYSLSQAPLSIVYPTFASTFIFVMIISAFMLKEKINKLRFIGILLVFVGITVIAVSA